VVSINLQENIGYSHFAHSYVRGNWRNSELACPAILAKSCHDLDLLYWLAGSRAERIASSGELTWFRAENAPDGAPEQCLDGCPARDSCPWYAPDLYLAENTGWPASIISDDTSLEARIRALETGPYGRCVYHCDNDVVDHQHSMINFANGVTASFALCAFTAEKSREIRVGGTAGEIVGDLQEGWLELRTFLTGQRDRITLNAPVTGHNGGDDALMNDIAALFGSPQGEIDSRSRLEESLEGHWMAFAAEKSRATGTIVAMEGFREFPGALSASGQ
jgi:predicted dehydrogenase